MKPILHVKINNARTFGKCDQMHKFAKSLKIILGGFYNIVFTDGRVEAEMVADNSTVVNLTINIDDKFDTEKFLDQMTSLALSDKISRKVIEEDITGHLRNVDAIPFRTELMTLDTDDNQIFVESGNNLLENEPIPDHKVKSFTKVTISNEGDNDGITLSADDDSKENMKVRGYEIKTHDRSSLMAAIRVHEFIIEQLNKHLGEIFCERIEDGNKDNNG